MLTCQQLTEIVTDYLEGKLGFWDRMRFQMHVGMCRPCRAFLQNRKMAIETLGRLPDEPIPPEVKAELLKRFREWKS